MLKNGTSIKRDLLFKLLYKENSDLKLCPKITLRHLTVMGPERMKVRLATQLFSNSVANAVLEYFPEETILSNFILTVDSFFDVFNSRSEHSPNKPLRAAFGINYNEQLMTLEQMYSLTSSMLAFNNAKVKKSLLPFQHGILQSINSLRQLYEFVHTQFGTKYILTYKLTQDALENFFCQIRGLGQQYDHPTPLEFKHRMKLLLIRKNLDYCSRWKSENKTEEQTFSVGIFNFEENINNSQPIQNEFPGNPAFDKQLGPVFPRRKAVQWRDIEGSPFA